MAKDLKQEFDIIVKQIPSDKKEEKVEITNKQFDVIKEYVEQLVKQNSESQEEIKHQVAENRNMLNRRDEVEANLRKYGASRLGEAIIPNIDLLKQVVASAENIDSPEVKNYLAGFEMVLAKMEDALSEVGISQIKVEVGSEYDSTHEQSIEQVESDKFKSGQVVEVISNGYKIHDRVLIHAKVKVAK